jgi:hypothetical protein
MSIYIYIYIEKERKESYIKINMEDSLIRLNDLPDEILMMIFKKLDNFDVLYSLIGVNKGLDTIAKDSTFTKCLTLEIPDNHLKQFSDTVLKRFCFEIVPKIHYEIQWINVESSHMERILRLTNYPKLYGLGLYDLAAETARDLFTGKLFPSNPSLINCIRISK